LLGPGKGIEWALRALAELKDLSPMPTYTVAGRTHPKVLEQHGDVYRDGLKTLARDLGVADAVRWADVYLDQAALSRLIRSADVVVLPYDSTEQVTSGVLIEAVGAGVPVVATEFPHAVELLADGPGLLVPHQDPEAMAAAVRHLIAEPAATRRLAGLAGGPTLRWPAVAARYQSLASELLAQRTRDAAPVARSVPA
jgi:glycosyltransferase involved in cell wall biosynthesis